MAFISFRRYNLNPSYEQRRVQNFFISGIIRGGICPPLFDYFAPYAPRLYTPLVISNISRIKKNKFSFNWCQYVKTEKYQIIRPMIWNQLNYDKLICYGIFIWNWVPQVLYVIDFAHSLYNIIHFANIPLSLFYTAAFSKR